MLEIMTFITVLAIGLSLATYYLDKYKLRKLQRLARALENKARALENKKGQ